MSYDSQKSALTVDNSRKPSAISQYTVRVSLQPFHYMQSMLFHNISSHMDHTYHYNSSSTYLKKMSSICPSLGSIFSGIAPLSCPATLTRVLISTNRYLSSLLTPYYLIHIKGINRYLTSPNPFIPLFHQSATLYLSDVHQVLRLS